MLNEMEVIERLDWFKEIYLKFRGSFGLELRKVKGIQNEERRKVYGPLLCVGIKSTLAIVERLLQRLY